MEAQTTKVAAEKAEQDAKARAAEEEAAKATKLERDKAEAERQEALKPDKERLLVWINGFDWGQTPALTDSEAQAVLDSTITVIDTALESARKMTKAL